MGKRRTKMKEKDDHMKNLVNKKERMLDAWFNFSVLFSSEIVVYLCAPTQSEVGKGC